MSKRSFKIIRNVIILILLVLIMYFYITNKYKYIVGNELLNQSYIVYGGDVDVEDQPVIWINSNQNIIPILKNKDVRVENLKDETEVYEVIEVKDMQPLTQYNINLEFTIKGLDDNQELTIGYQPQRINTLEDSKEDQKVNNIDLENSTTFIKAKDDYISIPLTITSNEEGSGYFFIGMNVVDKEEISYKISNLRLRK